MINAVQEKAEKPMARKINGNGSAETPEVIAQKLIEAKARKAMNDGIVRGSKIIMFFRNRREGKFNVESSADREVAFATAKTLISKGCVPA